MWEWRADCMTRRMSERLFMGIMTQHSIRRKGRYDKGYCALFRNFGDIDIKYTVAVINRWCKVKIDRREFIHDSYVSKPLSPYKNVL